LSSQVKNYFRPTIINRLEQFFPVPLDRLVPFGFGELVDVFEQFAVPGGHFHTATAHGYFGGLHQGSELSHLGQFYTLANVEDKSLIGYKQILVKMWYGVNPDIGIRLVAVDKQGKKYPMEAADIWLGGAPKGHRAMYFQFAEGLNKEELSHFILQKRPMALVRFSGFATEPKKAAVQAETPSEDTSLIWGEAVNGLRAAIEFVPEKESYSIPEQIDIRFHIQNVSDKPIEFISESYRPEPLKIEDANGNRQGTRENVYSGLPPITRHYLEPGREVVVRGLPLSIAQDEQQLESLGGPYGTDFKAKPGVYFVRAKLWIPGFLTSGRRGDFKGQLETGKLKLVVADSAGRLTATAVGGKGTLVEVDPNAADVLRRYGQALEQSDWVAALALCSEDVRKEAAKYASAEAFFRAVVPINEVLKDQGRPRTGYWPEPPKYFAYIFDVRIPQPDFLRDVFWVWKVRRLEGQMKWEIDFPVIAFESWLAKEKDGIERAAKERQQRIEELAPRFKGVKTVLSTERYLPAAVRETWNLDLGSIHQYVEAISFEVEIENVTGQAGLREPQSEITTPLK